MYGIAGCTQVNLSWKPIRGSRVQGMIRGVTLSHHRSDQNYLPKKVNSQPKNFRHSPCYSLCESFILVPEHFLLCSPTTINLQKDIIEGSAALVLLSQEPERYLSLSLLCWQLFFLEGSCTPELERYLSLSLLFWQLFFLEGSCTKIPQCNHFPASVVFILWVCDFCTSAFGF